MSGTSETCLLCSGLKNIPPGVDGQASAWMTAYLAGRALEREGVPTAAVMCPTHRIFAEVLGAAVDKATSMLSSQQEGEG